MPYLSNEEMGFYRSFHKDYFDKTARLKTISNVLDGAGGYTTTNAISSIEYSCLVRLSSGDEIEQVSKITDKLSYTITLPYGTPLKIKDILSIDNEDFEIVGVLDLPDSYSVEVSVLAVKSE
jgi:hypothetical protein